MATTIKLRNGTASAWTSANPTLAAGEAGVESDTLKFKIGNGSTAWNSLAYQGGGAPTGSAGGDLTGSYPNPSIGSGKVTNTMLAGSIDLTTKVTGTLPLANGGTGQTSASSAINALVPTQTSNSGKFLTTNGTAVSWDTVSGAPTGSAGGDLTGTYPNPTLTTSGVSAGTYAMGGGSSITVDAKGRATSVTGTGSVVTGRAVLTASQAITGTASWQDVTDLSLTLPGAGTYLVSACLAANVAISAGSNPRIQARLMLNGSAVTNSNITAVQGGTANEVDYATLVMTVTAAGAHVLKVQAMRTGTSPTWTSSNILYTSGETGSYLEYVQLESTGGDDGGSTFAQMNLLVNGDFRRMPMQARATLTGYATAASGTSADQFATNWGTQHNGSSTQMRNWMPGDSSPPVAFSVLGGPYLQLKNNDGSARGVALMQYLEASGPDGLSTVALLGQQIAASIRAVASTGTPTLFGALLEWQSTVDAPARPILGWASNLPSGTATGYANIGSPTGGTAVLNTSTATQLDLGGVVSSSAVGLMLVVYSVVPAGASLYLSQAWLGRGVSSPATWAPHPSDEELSLRYAENSFASGTFGDGTGGAHGVSAAAFSNQGTVAFVSFKVAKRAAPTITYYSSAFGSPSAGQWQAFHPPSSSWRNRTLNNTTATSPGFYFEPTDATTALTAGYAYYTAGHWVASARINPT